MRNDILLVIIGLVLLFNVSIIYSAGCNDPLNLEVSEETPGDFILELCSEPDISSLTVNSDCSCSSAKDVNVECNIVGISSISDQLNISYELYQDGTLLTSGTELNYGNDTLLAISYDTTATTSSVFTCNANASYIYEGELHSSDVRSETHSPSVCGCSVCGGCPDPHSCSAEIEWTECIVEGGEEIIIGELSTRRDGTLRDWDYEIYNFGEITADHEEYDDSMLESEGATGTLSSGKALIYLTKTDNYVIEINEEDVENDCYFELRAEDEFAGDDITGDLEDISCPINSCNISMNISEDLCSNPFSTDFTFTDNESNPIDNMDVNMIINYIPEIGAIGPDPEYIIRTSNDDGIATFPLGPPPMYNREFIITWLPNEDSTYYGCDGSSTFITCGVPFCAALSTECNVTDDCCNDEIGVVCGNTSTCCISEGATAPCTRDSECCGDLNCDITNPLISIGTCRNCASAGESCNETSCCSDLICNSTTLKCEINTIINTTDNETTNETGDTGKGDPMEEKGLLDDLFGPNFDCMFGDCNNESMNTGLFNTNLALRNGCTGFFIKINEWIICDILWIILILLSVVAGFRFRNEHKLVPIIVLLVPLIIGFFTYVWIGIIIALIEHLYKFAQPEKETKKKVKK